MDSCKASCVYALVGRVGIRPTSGVRFIRDSSYRPMGCRSFPAVISLCLLQEVKQRRCAGLNVRLLEVAHAVPEVIGI